MPKAMCRVEASFTNNCGIEVTHDNNGSREGKGQHKDEAINDVILAQPIKLLNVDVDHSEDTCLHIQVHIV